MCCRHLTIVQRCISGMGIGQWTYRYQNHCFLQTPKTKIIKIKPARTPFRISFTNFIVSITLQNLLSLRKKNLNSLMRGTAGTNFNLNNDSVSSLRVPFITADFIELEWLPYSTEMNWQQVKDFSSKVIFDGVDEFRVAYCRSLHQHSPRGKDNDLTVRYVQRQLPASARCPCGTYFDLCNDRKRSDLNLKWA